MGAGIIMMNCWGNQEVMLEEVDDAIGEFIRRLAALTS
jgi:hypothetical protein